jgi:hypothetical protein
MATNKLKVYKRGKDFRYAIEEKGELHVYGFDEDKFKVGDKIALDTKIKTKNVVGGIVTFTSKMKIIVRMCTK